ncbi:hypothetical protein TspCOW1_15400 [Thiohalobacter sp. COW1]|uniref:Signal transduction histidine kinase n=1 Tax=Thiohalobacter thiocyanaticus TaxID=585455 RepID=A0A1Z4VPJ7_9GAMM|nr:MULTISPECIES: hypothetical protein [Thiohalobacter]BAZ93521.1 signal transduction histidine kinase [Thiohalobacter thiocyanaticus]BCO31437.1 hypothetical protein TspCOW1_15400 [Thiohalobacter sp. COW1]
MNRPSTNTAVTAEHPHRDVLEAALMYLMTRYTQKPCPGLARGIMHHLQMLLAHPDLADSPVDRSAYESLLNDWGLIAFEHNCPVHAAGAAGQSMH